MILYWCVCVACCAMTNFSSPWRCHHDASKCSCRENDSLRNVWRVVFRASISELLAPFRICYVLYHFSDMSPRNGSVRNVWRASCRSRGGVLSSPNPCLSLRRRPRKRFWGKRDHNFVVAWLLAAHAPIARSRSRRCLAMVCFDCNSPFFLPCIFCIVGDRCRPTAF